MADITNRQQFCRAVGDGLKLVQSQRSGSMPSTEAHIADCLSIGVDTLRTLRYASRQRVMVEDKTLAALIWIVLAEGRATQPWLITILSATSIIPPEPLTTTWLESYLQSGFKQQLDQALLNHVVQSIIPNQAPSTLKQVVNPQVDAPDSLTTLPTRTPSIPVKPRFPNKFYQWLGLVGLISLLAWPMVSLFQATAASTHTPSNMALIPSGEYVQGSSDADIAEYTRLCQVHQTGCDSSWFADEQPQRLIQLDAFAIDRFEVSNRDFLRYSEAHPSLLTQAETQGAGYVWSDSNGFELIKGANWRHPHGPNSAITEHLDKPVVQITPSEAQAYCIWLGKRLPTEAEWEVAARGKQLWRFPWGNDWQPAKLNFTQGKLSPPLMNVDSLPEGQSAYGVAHLLGNAAEWTADWYDPHAYHAKDTINPRGPLIPTARHTRRGGSFASMAGVLHSTWRISNEQIDDQPSNGTGFRCVQHTALNEAL
ncbi:SUMF1/EgtB/PvdO family nonheme iron enzyme [Herpetosiphon gulosus]|uniref:Hercynine oxygenase n=1 Tax=Herpetosiphon gulosus TaxID=1973496 RepID=A0ABP9X0F3_9CHLR